MAEAKNARPPRIQPPSGIKPVEKITDAPKVDPAPPTPPIPPDAESSAPPADPTTFGDNIFTVPGQALTSKAKRMREILLHDERVPYIVPLDQGERPPAYLIVTLNGFPLKIQKGVPVELPKRIHTILMDNYRATIRALSGDDVPNQQGGFGIRVDRSKEAQSALT